MSQKLQVWPSHAEDGHKDKMKYDFTARYDAVRNAVEAHRASDNTLVRGWARVDGLLQQIAWEATYEFGRGRPGEAIIAAARLARGRLRDAEWFIAKFAQYEAYPGLVDVQDLEIYGYDELVFASGERLRAWADGHVGPVIS